MAPFEPLTSHRAASANLRIRVQSNANFDQLKKLRVAFLDTLLKDEVRDIKEAKNRRIVAKKSTV